MKFEIKQDEPEFKPITLTVIIETEEELVKLKEFLAWNVSVPAVFRDKTAGMPGGMESFTYELMRDMKAALVGQ